MCYISYLKVAIIIERDIHIHKRGVARAPNSSSLDDEICIGMCMTHSSYLASPPLQQLRITLLGCNCLVT